MTVTTLKQTIELADVSDIVVTPAVLDEENDVWVREIRVSHLVGEQQEIFFTLRLVTDVQANIDITAPVQQF